MNISDGVLIMDETAWKSWLRYIETRSEAAALQEIADLHKQHTSRTSLTEADGFGGGIFLTEIPETDLAVLEVQFKDQYSIGLYSQAEAHRIAMIIMSALGVLSDDQVQH